MTVPAARLSDAREAATEPAGDTRRRLGWLRGDGARQVIVTLIGIAFIIGVWQLFAMYVINPLWISSPRLVASNFASTFSKGTLVTNTAATTEEALIGLVAGVILGILLGVLLAELRPLAKILDPYIMGINSLPRIALAPFFVLWFGIGLFSKVLLVISVVMFIALFNVRQGMGSIDSDLIDVMRSMNAKRSQMFRQVTLPSLLPWIMSAIKIGIGSAIISAVVAEMVGADHGLGWSVTYALQEFDMTSAVTSMIMMVVLAVVLYGILALIERWLFRWRADNGPGSVAPM